MIKEIEIDEYLKSIKGMPENHPKITLFVKEYRWLSNFHEKEITIDGIKYATNEHAYMAIRCLRQNDKLHHDLIVSLKAGKDVKKIFNELRDKGVIGETPFSERLSIMAQCIEQKFDKGSELAEKLVATGQSLLVEGNWWKDTFWGVYNNSGSNNLGKLIMKRREQLSGIPSESWLVNYFNT